MSIEGDRYNAGFFSPGDTLAASQLSDLAAQAARTNQVYSNGSLIAQGTFGTVNMAGSVTGGTAQVYDFPFKVTVGPGASANQWKVYVRAGTVNSWIPKVLGGPSNGKYLDDIPQPYIEMNSASGNIKYVVMRATVDETKKFFPNTTEVYLVDSLESIVDSVNNGYILIASLSLNKQGSNIVSVASINQFVYSSMALIRVKGGEQTVWNWTSR